MHIKDTVWISLGENCLAQGIINRFDLPTAVSPFSWGRSNVEYLIQIISNDFVGFLDPGNLIGDARYGKTIAINSSYSCNETLYDASVRRGFEFTHHDVVTSAEARDSMMRKVDRFRECLDSQSNICFAYNRRYGSPTSSPDQVCDLLSEFLDMIVSRRPKGTTTHCLMLNQTIVDDACDRKAEVTQKGCVDVATISCLDVWAGNDQDKFWAKVDDDLLRPLFDSY